MEVVVGTYEGLILGYSVIKENCKAREKYISKPTFIDNSHTGCIKTLNISSNKILSSAGIDEIINLIDLNSRITLGPLAKHESEITSLKTRDDKYLYASGKDGNISVWSMKNWNCDKLLKGHLGPVSSISIHHSGKLMLSLSHTERKLFTWNLTHGKKAFVTNLNKDFDKVLWSPTGQYYLLFSSNHMQLYRLETAKVEMSLKFGQKLTAATFLNDKTLIVAVEKGVLKFYDLINHNIQTKFCTNQNRIKDIIVTTSYTEDDKFLNSSPANNSNLLITSSSDGTIKIHTLNSQLLSMENVLTIETSCRITCMAISIPCKSSQQEDSSENLPDLSKNAKSVEMEDNQNSAKKRLKSSPADP